MLQIIFKYCMKHYANWIVLYNMKQTADQKQVQKILNGSSSAFRDFVEEHKRLVSHIVFRMIYDHEDRKDLCQDVFVKIYQNLHTFKFESKVSTWVARIAYNTCINHLQKKQVPLFNDHAPADMDLDHLNGHMETPEDVTEAGDTHSLLDREIQNLPPKYRTILALYHLQEMSYAEIGQVLNLPEGTVKSDLYRARKQLKERIVAQYKTEDF